MARRKARVISRAYAIDALWRMGDIQHKLRAHQLPLYQHIKDRAGDLETLIKCGRRFGKTFTVLLWICEESIKRPGIQVRIAAPTEKALRKIIRPNLRVILADCPDDLRPTWNQQDGVYTWPNGTEWHIAGTDNDHAEKLRGTGTDIGFIDEAGFHDDLEYLCRSILLPQVMDRPGGRLISVSTPPETPAHYFSILCVKAQAAGKLYTRTTRDNTHMSESDMNRLAEAMGGWDSTAVRRELMCEDVTDERRAIVPEFNADRMSRIVQPVPPPSYEIPIVAIDVGFEDLTAVLFGYWNFRDAALCIQREAIIRRGRTDQIADIVRSTEAELWGKDPAIRVQRWSDTDLRLIADLCELHKLAVQPTQKDDKEAQVNALRMLVKNEKLRIDPACVTLIEHLRAGIWNKARTGFERTTTHGHFDAIDAAVYMLRNAPRYVNPYPMNPGFDPATMTIRGGGKPERSESAESIATLFRTKKPRPTWTRQ
jgi:hypothetical protein